VKLDEKRMVRLAWLQLWMSLGCIPVFLVPIPTSTKVVVLGLMSALTWTGTALGHISAARANKAIVEVQADGDAEIGHADHVEIDKGKNDWEMFE
jgi:hypothetical protein